MKTGSDTSYWYSDSPWSHNVLYYENGKLRNFVEYAYQHSSVLDLREKYIALLCVDIVKEPASQYTKDVFHTYGVYAVYDYLAEEKPSLEALQSRGFLPVFRMFVPAASVSFVSGEPDVAFSYQLCMYDFKDCRADLCKTISSVSEVCRFVSLLQKRSFPSSPVFADGPVDAFATRIAYDTLQKPLCTLIEEDIPPMPTPTKVELSALHKDLWRERTPNEEFAG